MAVTGKNDQSGTGAFIATSPGTTLFTVTAAHIYTVGKLNITNIDTSSAIVYSVYHIPSGGSFSAPDYAIVYLRSLGPSDGVTGVEDVREIAGEIFEAGDKLVVVAGTGSKLKFSVSYVDNG